MYKINSNKTEKNFLFIFDDNYTRLTHSTTSDICATDKATYFDKRT